MTTELEEQFYKMFRIKPIRYIVDIGQWDCETNSRKSLITDISIDYYDKHFKNNNLTPLKGVVYPEITDRKLLEMICIYNSFQNDEASLFIPFDINNVKDIALQVITKSIKDKSLNNYYCNDVEKLKTKIQQLFKEEE